jgi:fatty-acyl-CoA synthase
MEPLQENLLRRATLGDLMTRSALRFPDRVALVSGDKPVSYKTLNEHACQAAHAFLRLGIGRGDRVALMTHNCLEYVYLRLGLAKIGAAPVPLNFMLKGDEIAFIVNNAEAKAFFVEDVLAATVAGVKDKLPSVKHFGWIGIAGKVEKPAGWSDAAGFFGGDYPVSEPEVLVESTDMASIMYTTGTEGFPKGVMTSHLNYFMTMMHIAVDVDLGRKDVLILDIPLFHIAGTTVLNAALTFGAKVLIDYAPNPVNILKKTQEERVTMWIYPPTIYQALPTVPGFANWDLSSLKKCISFGSAMPPVILERWRQIKPDIEWRNYYGQTESSPLGTTSSPEDSDPASIGSAATGATVKVFDEQDREVPHGTPGELVIRGPAVMMGYWRNAETTRDTLRNGWLHTGDIGYQNAQGKFYFVDRKKDIIKTGGENVSSQEVEAMILRHPKVAQAAVIAIPDARWIEAVAAWVVLKPNQTATEQDIIGFCKENLAGYKVPKKIVFAAALPVSPTGKILKRKIKEEHLKAGVA